MRWLISNPWTWLVNRHVDRAFHCRSDGTVAFYPFGKWTDGYLAATGGQEARLRAAMRQYVLFYLRYGTGFFAVMAAVYFLVSKLLPSIATRLPVWWIGFSSVALILAPLPVLVAFDIIWKRKFSALARDFEVLPPTFTRFRAVQNAAALLDRPSLVLRASGALTVAAASIALVVWQYQRLDALGAVILSLVALAGLAYYMWCRSIMDAQQGARRRKP